MKPQEIISAIIKEQSNIIGESLAKQMAENSGVVKFNSANLEDFTISDNKLAIEKIVNSYGNLFGQASIDVCIDVMRKFPQDTVLPLLSDSLKELLR